MVRGKVLVPGATGDTGRASVDEDLVEKLGGNTAMTLEEFVMKNRTDFA